MHRVCEQDQSDDERLHCPSLERSANTGRSLRKNSSAVTSPGTQATPGKNPRLRMGMRIARRLLSQVPGQPFDPSEPKVKHDRSGLWAPEPLDEFRWEPSVPVNTATSEPRVEFVNLLPGTDVLDTPHADVAVAEPRTALALFTDRRKLWTFASGTIFGALVCFVLVSLTTSALPQEEPLSNEPASAPSAPAPISSAVLETAPPERSLPVPKTQPVVQKASQPATFTAKRQDVRPIAVPVPPSRTPSRNGSFIGSLRIDSTPRGARVFINRAPAGVTPLVLPDLRAGSHAVRVEADGHLPWSSAIRVIADQQTNVHAPLTPLHVAR